LFSRNGEYSPSEVAALPIHSKTYAMPRKTVALPGTRFRVGINVRKPPVNVSNVHVRTPADRRSTERPHTFSVPVPPGKTIVRVSRGPEYNSIVREIEVFGDTTLDLVLTRLLDMASYGWYCGDTHVHINHDGGSYTLLPADAHLMARTEGLRRGRSLASGA
jgi:hypothetical protein